MIDLETGYVDSSHEPLRWAMHGGPGTGKTHVIKIIKEYFSESFGMEYKCGIPNCSTSSCDGGFITR